MNKSNTKRQKSDQLLSVADAASIVGVSEKLMRDYCDQNIVKSMRLPLSKHRRIYYSDLESFMVANGFRVPVERASE